TVMAVASLLFSAEARGEEPDITQNSCDGLRNAVPADLVQFLNGVTPDDKNGDFVAWGVKRLGRRGYEAAVVNLVKLLDFRRPPTPLEKQGVFLRPLGIWELYPATDALCEIGKKVLPEVLRAIGAASTYEVARENAVFVWMETHRRDDERAKGVARL